MNSEIRNVALLIVDDHPVYRDALGEKFSSAFLNWKTPIKLAADTHEGIQILQDNPAYTWLVILDLLLPNLSAEQSITLFKKQPQVQHVVAISGLDEREGQALALSAGASTFISKNNASHFICARVRELLEMPSDPITVTQGTSPEFRLTSRQLEVLALIADGHPNKIIADRLAISEQTVKIHINQIFRELKVFNRTQAVLKAQKFLLV